jgi:hypothetical protein
MEPSTAWEVNSRLATEEFINTLWNQKVQHSVHKNSPLVPILSQINPFHNLSFYFPKINFNIILPPTCRSS